MNIGVVEEAYKKITAVVVYTESLEGLMFSDFRYVWQRCGAGPRFRMWVLDESLRKREWENKSNILLNITGMNPSEGLTQMAMLDYKSKTEKEKKEAPKAYRNDSDRSDSRNNSRSAGGHHTKASRLVRERGESP